jgi:hypothetical protein
MISISTIIIISLVVASLSLKGADRWCAVIYTLCAVIHAVLSADLPGLIYFGSAAMLDLCMIVALTCYIPKSSLSEKLTMLSFLSIWINFAGWTMWMISAPFQYYATMMMILYGAAIFVIGTGRRVSNAVSDRVDRGASNLHPNIVPGMSCGKGGVN